MRGLKWAVGIMSVLIVVGTVTLLTLVAMRATGGSTGGSAVAQILLDEPTGTRLASASLSAAGDRVLVSLEGGGPSRLAVVDLRTGRVLSRVALAR